MVELGHTYADVTVIGMCRGTRIRRILVDTGATFTTLNEKILAVVEAAPIPGRVPLEMGDGRRVRARAYAVRIKLGRRAGPAVAVSFRGAKQVVGVETLESLGLTVNVKKRALQATRPEGLAYFYTTGAPSSQQPDARARAIV